MAISGQSGCIWANVVVFGQKWLYSVKVVLFGKVAVFGQGGCIQAKVVVFGQKLLYSGKSDGIRANEVIFEQSGCVLAKVVVIGKSGCMRAS